MSVDLGRLPTPGERRLALRVTPAAERALRAGHPWLFADAIHTQSHVGQPGDLAVIFDRKGRFLAIGLFDPHSPIRVRILQHDRSAPIDSDWFAHQLQQAAQRRLSLTGGDTTGYRLVHGENDGLPGLVLDRYGETLVMKLYTPAWIPHLVTLLPLLQTRWPHRHLVLRLSRWVARLESSLYGLYDGQLLQGDPPIQVVQFQENGLRFEADVVRGQKTGFFLDQRENRARVESLAAGQDVLNVFAYSGGFSLYAARGGARSVISLDSSGPALAAAASHFDLNQHHPAIAATEHHLLTGDAFAQMANLARTGRRFGLVIIDPPAFAKQQSEIQGALSAYQRLMQLGLSVLKSGGQLVMASCSSRVSAEEFFATLHSAAQQAGRPLHEQQRTGHPLDHPIGFPEGAYLKCLYATAS